MPTAASCCWKIAALVERRSLPTVVNQRNDAGWPPQLKKLLLPRVGTEGPPVQPCAFSSAMAFFCDVAHLPKCGSAALPRMYSRLFSGFTPGAYELKIALISETRLMARKIACRIHGCFSSGLPCGPCCTSMCSKMYARLVL